MVFHSSGLELLIPKFHVSRASNAGICEIFLVTSSSSEELRVPLFESRSVQFLLINTQSSDLLVLTHKLKILASRSALKSGKLKKKSTMKKTLKRTPKSMETEIEYNWLLLFFASILLLEFYRISLPTRIQRCGKNKLKENTIFVYSRHIAFKFFGRWSPKCAQNQTLKGRRSIPRRYSTVWLQCAQ